MASNSVSRYRRSQARLGRRYHIEDDADRDHEADEAKQAKEEENKQQTTNLPKKI